MITTKRDVVNIFYEFPIINITYYHRIFKAHFTLEILGFNNKNLDEIYKRGINRNGREIFIEVANQVFNNLWFP